MINSIDKFDYPNNLQLIFDKLNNYNINSIIIGGYIRDFFLNIDSKDIDIELYGISSFEKLERILKEFGEVNSVGKSFGVCKLTLKEFEIDFTLPRIDSKTSSGHRGFNVEVDKNLDFKSATSRRDFTINAIGYDTKKKKILDPFHGVDDLKNKILKAVDIKKFAEDPLRVLRAIGFSSRLNFKIDNELFMKCKEMCDKKLLNELAPQRVYDEIVKILLKSEKPSVGFSLLRDINALIYLAPLNRLNREEFQHILNILDEASKLKTNTDKTNITIMLSALCYKFNTKQTIKFISNLTNKKELIKEVISLTSIDFKVIYSDSELLRLAKNVNIELFLQLNQSIYRNINNHIFIELKKRAIELNILNKKAPALLQGRDILLHGIKPSKEYSLILEKAYEAQINLEINNPSEAKEWLKKFLVS